MIPRRCEPSGFHPPSASGLGWERKRHLLSRVRFSGPIPSISPASWSNPVSVFSWSRSHGLNPAHWVIFETMCVYISIYIHIHMCCGVINWAKFGGFKVINWPKSKLLTGPRSFSHCKNRGFKRCCYHCVLGGPIIWQFSKNSLFQKRVQKLGFSIFCVFIWIFENYLF